MQGQGAEVDIQTGRPLIQTQEAAAARLAAQEEERLVRQARYAEILTGPHGEKILGIVRGFLEKRIDELVRTDPEAKAYLTILSDLGAREAVGRQAAETLMNRQRQRKPAAGDDA